MKKILVFCGFMFLGNCLFGQELLSDYPFNLSPFANSKADRAADTEWLAFALNFFPGMGLGSFVQGDITGGIIGLCGELSGLALLVFGLIPEYQEIHHQGYYSDYYTTDTSYPNAGFAYAGLGILLGTRIFELIRPAVYATSFSVAIIPYWEANGQPGLLALVKAKR